MLILILLDIAWGISALAYDVPALKGLPAWAVPFIVICPLYPVLLAATWAFIRKENRFPPWLGAFAALPSAAYGILAAPFYLSIMAYEGFAWNSLLQIFWVLFYGGQGLFFLRRYRLPMVPLGLAAGFLAASFTVQYATDTFGYLGVTVLPQEVRTALYAAALGITGILVTLQRLRR